MERYAARFEAEGTLAAKPKGGRRRARLEAHGQRLREWISVEPDLTLAELQERVKKRLRVPLGLNALWHTLRRLGLSYKKRPSALPSRSART